jgi:ABC-type branched-subunit amino acid transport system substrate-binding protein
MLRGPRVIPITVVVAVAWLGLTGSPASSQSNEKPTATEIGVTEDEIRIGVVADVDNSFVPGIFQGARDGVIGAAKYINANGGIAGRKLIVDFYDSKLNANETRNAFIEACEKDFALVGTTALFVTSAEELVNCPDSAGRATGLPDIAGITTSLVQACSPVSYSTTTIQVLCDTLDEPTPTQQGNVGPFKFYDKRLKGDAHGALLFSNDTPDARRTGVANLQTAKEAGIVADVEQGLSSRDPQSAYTPVVQRMKTAGSNFAYLSMAFNSVVQLRQEALLQGIDSSKVVWMCPQTCYDHEAIEDAGDTLEGEQITMQYLPFEEASTNKMLANFIKYTGRDKADGFAVWGWTSGIALQEVLTKLVQEQGVNAVTRANLLEGLENLDDFDSGGIIGKTDVGNKIMTPCYMLIEWKDGEYTRVHPAKKGTFDCKPSNRVTFPMSSSGA